jgi:quercetin dioxygenase-like cupin family protein
MSNRRFTLPDGTSVVITKSARSPEVEPFEPEMTVPPEAEATPAHVHPAQTDEFEVLSGSLEILVGQDWRELRAGESLTIPPGQVHTYRNTRSPRMILAIARLWSEHQDVMRFARPSFRLLISALAALARVTGVGIPPR